MSFMVNTWFMMNLCGLGSVLCLIGLGLPEIFTGSKKYLFWVALTLAVAMLYFMTTMNFVVDFSIKSIRE